MADKPKPKYTPPPPAKKPAPKSELAEMTLNPIKNLKRHKSRLDQAIEDSGG